MPREHGIEEGQDFLPCGPVLRSGVPRGKRICPAGMVFHCLNRAVGRQTLFEKEADYEAFEKVLEKAHERTPLRVLDYAVMPNHWHFVAWLHYRRGSKQVFQLVHRHAYDAVACALPHQWDGPSLSGTVNQETGARIHAPTSRPTTKKP